MAMTKCKECGNTVSNKAASCPSCGAPLKKKSKAGCLVAIILSLFVVIGMYSSVNKTESKPSKTLAVQINRDSQSITVKNIGSAEAAGGQLLVYINGSPPSAFKAEASMPTVGSSVRLNLSSFTKRDGTRFNPATHAVTETWVGGGGYDYVQFK